MTATTPQQASNILICLKKTSIVDDTHQKQHISLRMLTEQGYKPQPVLRGKLALRGRPTSQAHRSFIHPKTASLGNIKLRR